MACFRRFLACSGVIRGCLMIEGVLPLDLVGDLCQNVFLRVFWDMF